MVEINFRRTGTKPELSRDPYGLINVRDTRPIDHLIIDQPRISGLAPVGRDVRSVYGDDFDDFFTKTIHDPLVEQFQEETLPGITRRLAPSSFYSSDRQRADQRAQDELLTNLTRSRAGLKRQSALDEHQARVAFEQLSTQRDTARNRLNIDNFLSSLQRGRLDLDHQRLGIDRDRILSELNLGAGQLELGEKGLQTEFEFRTQDDEIRKYIADLQAETQRYGIDRGFDIAEMQDITNQLGITTGAETQRRGQDVQRYGIDTGAETTRRGQDVQQDIALLQEEGRRYGIDVGANTQRYGIDVGRDVSRMQVDTQREIATLQDLTDRYGIDTTARVEQLRMDLQSDIVDRQLASQEGIAALDRDAQTDWHELDAETRRAIADTQAFTQRYVADLSAETQLEVANLDAETRISIATLDSDLRQQGIDLQKLIADNTIPFQQVKEIATIHAIIANQEQQVINNILGTTRSPTVENIFEQGTRTQGLLGALGPIAGPLLDRLWPVA